MPSPACEVKDGAGAYQATTNGVNVTPANTITIHLIDSSANSWSISCVTTDETSVAATVNAGLTIDPIARTATFTAPAAGKAYRFRSVVNGGIGPDGKAVASYSTTLCVYTLVSTRRVHAADETVESNATFGWLGDINTIIRTPATVPTGTGFRKVVAGLEQAAAEPVDLADATERTGTLPIANGGTGLVALGAALQVLRTNAGVTAMEWATVGTVPGGSSGQVQWNSAGAFAGTSQVSTDGTYLAIGTGSLPTTGVLRLANATAVRARNAGGSADITVAETTAGNELWVGGTSGSANRADYLQLCAANYIALRPAGGDAILYLDPSAAKISQPLRGYSSAWGGVNGVGTQAMADANQTPAAGVYECATIVTTGALTARRTLTIPAATDLQAYLKPIDNQCTGAVSVGVTTGAGSVVDVATRMRDLVLVDSRGVAKVAAGCDLEMGLRLSLESGVSDSIMAQTAKTTIYLTPHESGRIALLYGGVWQTFDTAEISLALGTVTSGRPYDVFAYWSGSAVALAILAWTNDVARATGLASVNGRLCKSDDYSRLWVGTFYATSTTTTEDSATNRYVYNAFNQLLRPVDVAQTADTSTSSGTFVNLLTGNFVTGREQHVTGHAYLTAAKITAGGNGYLRLQLDAATACCAQATAATNEGLCLSAQRAKGLAIGKHTATLDWYTSTASLRVNAATYPDTEGAALTIDLFC